MYILETAECITLEKLLYRVFAMGLYLTHTYKRKIPIFQEKNYLFKNRHISIESYQYLTHVIKNRLFCFRYNNILTLLSSFYVGIEKKQSALRPNQENRAAELDLPGTQRKNAEDEEYQEIEGEDNAVTKSWRKYGKKLANIQGAEEIDSEREK